MLRSYRPWLAGLFLVIIYAVPVTQAVVEASRGGWPQALDFFRQRPTAANLRAFERDTERSSVVAGAARPWIQYLRFVALRDPGDKAILGSGGWLFYKPDVRYLVEPSSLDGGGGDPAAVTAIVKFRGQLARLGIHLLVVPVPGKPSVYPDLLTLWPESFDGRWQSHTGDLLARLRARGVAAVDLRELLVRWRRQEPSYLQHDTHWTPSAARAAAGLVAARLRESGWVPVGSTEFTTRPVSVRRRGDVVRMMESPQLDAMYAPEQVECEQVWSEASRLPYSDDANSPVLVLGDSFLRIYQTDEPKAAGFIAHLARELRTAVASIVSDGGAATQVRLQLARQATLLRGKRVVVWEFVERDLRLGADGWQDVEMPAPDDVMPASAVTSH